MNEEFIYEVNSLSEDLLLDKNLFEPELTQKQQLVLELAKRASVDNNHIGLLRAYRPSLISKVAPRWLTEVVVKSRQRLIVSHILKKGIQRNDDQTICNWFSESLIKENDFFSELERSRIKLAIFRQIKLIEFRHAVLEQQFEQAISIFNEAELSSTNLFTVQDKQLLENAISQIAKSKEEHTVSRETGFHLKEYSESSTMPIDEIGEFWLGGKFESIDNWDVSDRKRLAQEIQRIGFRARVERALKRKEKKYLQLLLRDDAKIKQEWLGKDLWGKVALLLEEKEVKVEIIEKENEDSVMSEKQGESNLETY